VNSRRWVVGPTAIATLVVAVGWFAVAGAGFLLAHDVWGIVLVTGFGLAGIGTLVLAATLIQRLTDDGVFPLIGRGFRWEQIEAVTVRRRRAGVSTLAVEVQMGRSVASRDLDIVGPTRWVDSVAADIAARAHVSVREATRERRQDGGGGRFAA
jgi:hypothetical protein